MKKLVLVIIFAACSINLLALDISQLDIFEIEKSADIPVKLDFNGDECAYMLIESNLPDLKIEGSILGTDIFDGKQLLSIPSGTKSIELVQPQMLPLKIDFKDFLGSNPVGGHVYQLVANVEIKAPEEPKLLTYEDSITQARKLMLEAAELTMANSGYIRRGTDESKLARSMYESASALGWPVADSILGSIYFSSTSRYSEHEIKLRKYVLAHKKDLFFAYFSCGIYNTPANSRIFELIDKCKMLKAEIDRYAAYSCDWRFDDQPFILRQNDKGNIVSLELVFGKRKNDSISLYYMLEMSRLVKELYTLCESACTLTGFSHFEKRPID